MIGQGGIYIIDFHNLKVCNILGLSYHEYIMYITYKSGNLSNSLEEQMSCSFSHGLGKKKEERKEIQCFPLGQNLVTLFPLPLAQSSRLTGGMRGIIVMWPNISNLYFLNLVVIIFFNITLCLLPPAITTHLSMSTSPFSFG